MNELVLVTVISPPATYGISRSRRVTCPTCASRAAGIAAVLAAVGLYGVLGTAVRQRTAEIGIRLTFGASRGNILQLILGHGLLLDAVGIGLGLVGAFAITRAMRSLLMGVTHTDPVTYVIIAILFLAVATLACWVPAWRAAGLDPNVVLREE